VGEEFLAQSYTLRSDPQTAVATWLNGPEGQVLINENTPVRSSNALPPYANPSANAPYKTITLYDQPRSNKGMIVATVLAILILFTSFIVFEATRPSSQELRSKIEMGMSNEEVRAAIGSPERTQRMESAGGVDLQLWYYNGIGLQITFDDGRVSSINQW
jgi:hypothetical protein